MAIGSFAWDTTVWVFDMLCFYYRVFAYSGRWRDLINEECDGKFHERLAELLVGRCMRVCGTVALSKGAFAPLAKKRRSRLLLSFASRRAS